MKHGLFKDGEINEIAEVLLREYEIDISKFEDSFLRKSIEKRLRSGLFNSPAAYRDYLKFHRNEAYAFFDSLHISFSEFFRGSIAFAYLENIIIPQIIEKKKKDGRAEIRIWSAACAAGQEVFSAAIILDEIINKLNIDIACSVFATDINPIELNKAGRGIYNGSALSKVTLDRICAYFSVQGENYILSPRIREYVDFSIFDLVSGRETCPPESVYGNFDLVFCCNILFYYKSRCHQIIFDKLSNCLAAGGYLITGESERKIAIQNGCREVFPSSAIFQF